MTEATDRQLELLDRFEGTRVLVVGDVMLDEYLHGAVERISPEAPVPIVRLRERVYKPGGAANVALNLHHLGATVQLIGLVGTDEAGTQLRTALSDAGLDLGGLVDSTQRRTTRKARVMSAGQQLMRVDTEDTQPATGAEAQGLLARVSDYFRSESPQVVVFEDYDKGTLTSGLISLLLDASAEAGAATVVDPKSRNFWAYRGVTLFKPNALELTEALAARGVTADLRSEAGLREAHRALHDQLGHSATLVTLGAQGAALVGRGFHQVPATELRIADVCGAGDSVAAVATLAVATGAGERDLLNISNLAGGLACGHLGVRPLHRAELRDALRARASV